MELSVAIQAKVEVTPSNWNFGFQPTYLHGRDYFGQPDASPACSFAPQGLFPPAGCISILLFCSTRIISAGQMHLYLALLLHRDYFAPAGCISILLFCSTGIISAGQMHLYLALLFHRDYYGRPNASLSCSFAPQGLFPPARFISILLFCSTGIISAVQMHLYLALLSRLLDFLLFLSRSPAQTSIAPMIP